MLNALLGNELALAFIVVFLTAFFPMAIYAIYRKRQNNQSSTYSVQQRYSDRFRYQNTTQSKSNDSTIDCVTAAVVVHAALSSSDTISGSSTSSDGGSSCDGGSM